MKIRVRNDQVRKALDLAMSYGCTVDDRTTRNNHGVIRDPEGRVVARFALGDTDPRSGRNLMADIRRWHRQRESA